MYAFSYINLSMDVIGETSSWDFEYVGIYVQKTFVGIAYIILIAYYHIINEFKM